MLDRRRGGFCVKRVFSTCKEGGTGRVYEALALLSNKWFFDDSSSM